MTSAVRGSELYGGRMCGRLGSTAPTWFVQNEGNKETKRHRVAKKKASPIVTPSSSKAIKVSFVFSAVTKRRRIS